MGKYIPVKELVLSIFPKVIKEQVNFIHRHIYERDWKRAWYRAKAFIDFIFMMPNLVRSRVTMRGRYGYGLFLNLKPTYIPIALPYLKWDYERSCSDNVQCSRIIVGVTDNFLGDGWYPIQDEAPQYRWIANEADCYLNVVKPGLNILQLHVRQPLEAAQSQILRILINNKQVGKFSIPDKNWHTYHLPYSPSDNLTKVTLKVTPYIPAEAAAKEFDRGLQINEVSLLPEGSVFIRKVTDCFC
jgi:hypothetical protein